MTEPQTRRFKIILLGDSDVGKTTLLHRYIHDGYSPSADITIPADFHHHSLEIEPGVQVKLQIVDTNGHERFRQLILSYTRCVHGFLLVFDLNRQDSFESIRSEWIPFVHKSEQRALCVLVGLKSELKDRCVSGEEAEELAKELEAPYVEASSLTGHNVKEAFETLVQQIYREKQKQEAPKEEPGASWSCLLM